MLKVGLLLNFVKFTRYGDGEPSDARNRVGLTQLGRNADRSKFIFPNTALFLNKKMRNIRYIYIYNRFNKSILLQISKQINFIVADPYCVKGLCG
jgi:hypothetical protein